MAFQLQGRKVLESDAHGPVVIKKMGGAMSFRPVDHSKPVPLSSLEVGDTFKLYWEGGRHPQGAEGTLLLINQSRARVRLLGESQTREFTERSGAVRVFKAPSVLETDWSPGTLVIKTGTGEGEPIVGKMNFNPAAVQPEVLSKEDTVATKAKAKAKGNGKAKAVKKEPENKCGCGCGTMVMRTFAQGHDARFYGWAKKIAAGTLDPKDLPNAAAKAALKDKAAARKALANHG